MNKIKLRYLTDMSLKSDPHTPVAYLNVRRLFKCLSLEHSKVLASTLTLNNKGAQIVSVGAHIEKSIKCRHLIGR